MQTEAERIARAALKKIAKGQRMVVDGEEYRIPWTADEAQEIARAALREADHG